MFEQPGPDLKEDERAFREFPVGYRINDFSLVSSIWEGKCPSPDRLPHRSNTWVSIYRAWDSCALALSRRGLGQSAVKNGE